MTGRTKATVLALVIFAAGVLMGGLLTFRLVQVNLPRPGDMAIERPRPGRNGGPERIMRDLTERLDLDSEQQEELRAILRRTRERMISINQEANRKQQGLRRETRQKIQAVLSPEQAKQFEGFLSRMEKRWRGGRRGGNPARNPNRFPEEEPPR